MKISNLLLASILILNSSIPVYAAQESTTPVNITVAASEFKVTVPTALPIDVAADGTIITAQDAKIINNSNGPIKLVTTKVETKNNWTLGNYSDDFAKLIAGTKKIGFNILNTNVPVGTSVEVSGGQDIAINAGDNLPIPYTAKVAAQKVAINEEPLSVIFTLDWVLPAPDKYVLASDDDFYLEEGVYKYTGADDYVEIPTTINGEPVTSYAKMFQNTQVSGVKSNAHIEDVSEMFSGVSPSEGTLDLSEFHVSGMTNMNGMFMSVRGNIIFPQNFDTSNVTDMSSMFYAARSDLDVSSFDTSSVINMSNMFYGAYSLTGFESFDVSNVERFNSMFAYATFDVLDLSGWRLGNVKSYDGMFAGTSVSDAIASADNISSLNTFAADSTLGSPASFRFHT